MAFLNPSNQLLQIDSGAALTYLYNPNLGLGSISPYQGIGENQVLGQRYFGANYTAANPNGSPAIYMLVQYSSTAQPSPVAAPAPVYWTDQTYTTVSGVESEGWGLSSVAGYLLPNTASISGLTAAQLQGAYVLIQVAGPLSGAVVPASTAVDDWIIGATGNFTAGRVAAGTAPGYKTYGVATSAIASGVANLLLNCDII